MRWWIMPQPRHGATMAVDNDSVSGLNFSTLVPTNIHIVEWREGQGELELDQFPQLRTTFGDVTPYTPFFQQFITLLPGVSLAQAQKIQTDLITVLYEYKRQLPYRHAVAAGDFLWEATDALVTAMTATTIPALLGGTSGTGSSLVGQINALIAQINANYGTRQTQINANYNAWHTQINSNLATRINAFASEVNSLIVAKDNTLVSEVNSFVVGPGNSMIGTYDADMNTIYARLQDSGPSTVPAHYAAPGLAAPLPTAGVSFIAIDVSFPNVDYPMVLDPAVDLLSVTALSVSSIPVGSGPGAATLQFTPMGLGTPVTLTATEMSDILAGISLRRSNLLTTKFNKTAAVNALTTVPSVAAYDVTAGW
jgi:hypothetical protein